jgi:hypothetical protein
MIDPRFREPLRKAHVEGDGGAVAEIWREIADGKMSDADTLAWAKTVADWITSTDDPSRARTPSGEPIPQVKQSTPVPCVARIHAALAVTGWAEPSLDSLTDDDHGDDHDHGDPDGLAYDLMTAIGHRSERLAAEIIWRAIANGKAHDNTKLTWVEHVASKLVGNLIDNASLDDRLRGLQALNATGLWGIADRYADLRSHIQMVADFCELAGSKAVPEPMRIVPFMREQGLIEEKLSNRKAGKRAARQIKLAMEARRPKRP